MRRTYICAVAPFASRLTSIVAASVAALVLLGGCLATEGSVSKVSAGNPEPVVRLRVGVTGVTALGKKSVITLDRLEITMVSGSGDTLRDTVTTMSSPALNSNASSPQSINKSFELKALRSWKIYATVRDVLDSAVHRDSADIPVLYAGDTAVVSLNLSSRYARYQAAFLSFPDSVSSSVPSQPKQQLRINRLVLSIDGVVVRDSTATPGPYFAPGAPHSLDFDYVAAGTGTWAPVISGTAKNLNAIQFATRDTGFIAGDTVALKTVDGGVTWSAMPAPPRSMRSVSFVNGTKGVMGGDSATSAHTTNGGGSWSYQKISNFTFVASPVALVGDTGFGLTNATTFTGSTGYRRTLDGGATWTTRSSYANNIYGISCPTYTACWVVGYAGTIRKDANASGTFTTTQTSGVTKALRGVHFIDANRGWVVGDTGTILKTVNGGSSWSTLTSGVTQNLRAVHFIDSSIGYAVGENGTILATSNGGTTWAAQTSGTINHLNGVWFSGATGYVVGDGGIILKMKDVRQVEMRAYGPMGSWNAANPLFVGARYVNVTSGLDATVALVLRWTGPSTGTGKLDAAIGKTGKVFVDGGVPDAVIP